MKFLLVLLITGTLTCCVTTEKYELKLNSWINKTESELLSQWGIPNSTYELNDGGKMLMYYKNDGTIAMPVGYMYYSESYWCKTTFTLDSTGVIKNWKHEGNQCVSN